MKICRYVIHPATRYSIQQSCHWESNFWPVQKVETL